MRTNPNLILREIYGKAILIPIRTNEASNDPIYMNEVAVSIWKAAEEVENSEELLKYLCEKYELKENSAEAMAVESFISELLETKLLLR